MTTLHQHFDAARPPYMAGLPALEAVYPERLKLIRAEVRVALREKRTVEDGLRRFLASDSKARNVVARFEDFLKAKQAQAEAGELSPLTAAEYARHARPGGELSFWSRRAVGDVDTASLSDWNTWLSKRGMGPKSRRNALGVFRSFLAWLHERNEIAVIPRMPSIKVPKHTPRILALDLQRSVLEQIPELSRGIFLALSIGLRPGEARALDAQDAEVQGDRYFLTVSKAAKGKHAHAPIGPTKTGSSRRVPASPDLAEWLSKYWGPRERLANGPLFPNGRGRFSHWALQSRWATACKAAGVKIGLYEGTKHSFATAVTALGAPERALQEILGHADVRSTRLYAQLGSDALVRVVDLLKKR